MAAGLGFKTFTTGEVLTAADTNGYLMQGVLVFASAAARDAAITSPQEGQYAFLKDTDALVYYSGAAWLGAPVGDITAVTAGTGISGGGSSGDVTITNSMATAIDAKGDLIAGTAADTFNRLAVSASNVAFLRADSGETTGLKWDNDAWLSWTPTYTGFTVGNATVTAKYKQIGKTVFAWAKVVLGSTSSVSGDFTISLPVNTAIPFPVNMGSAGIEDMGTTQRPGFVIGSSATLVTIRAINTSGTYAAEGVFSSTVPQTWVAGDTIYCNLSYEAS